MVPNFCVKSLAVQYAYPDELAYMVNFQHSVCGMSEPSLKAVENLGCQFAHHREKEDGDSVNQTR